MGRTSEKLGTQIKATKESLPGMASEDKDFIHTVGKAFEVLRAFDAADARLGNQELAIRTGFPKSTISRITYTLTRLGYLAYLPHDQKYKIGAAAIGLSTSILSGLDFRFLIRSYLKELADYAECAVGMSIRDKFDVVYLEHCRSELHATLHRNFGSRIPLTKTAAGHAHIVALPSSEREALFVELERHDPENWPNLHMAIDRNIELYNKRGFVVSYGEWHEHINGVAVPVWSSRHSTSFAFNAGGPTTVLTKAKILNDIGPRLLELRSQVSVILNSLESENFPLISSAKS